MNPGDGLNFDKATNKLQVPEGNGAIYRAGGKRIQGSVTLTKNTTVRAYPRGRVFDEGVDTEWTFEISSSESKPADDDSNSDPAESQGEQENKVEDTPSGPTAGSTPQNPAQATGGPVPNAGAGAPRTPRP